MMRWSTVAALASGALLFAALAGCGNPALDVQIDALGGEVPGVEPGEFHRPGQPCLVCHGPYGGASPQMLVAGTIFAVPTGDKPIPVEGAEITIYDSLKTYTVKKKTNCVGNFYVEKGETDVLFPMGVTITCPTTGGETVAQGMMTQISREGSCNACHQGDRNQGSPGWVYCLEAPPHPYSPPGPSCPGVPSAGAQ